MDEEVMVMARASTTTRGTRAGRDITYCRTRRQHAPARGPIPGCPIERLGRSLPPSLRGDLRLKTCLLPTSSLDQKLVLRESGTSISIEHPETLPRYVTTSAIQLIRSLRGDRE